VFDCAAALRANWADAVRAVGAAAAGRQRHGEGARAGVPVADDSGHRVHATLEDLAKAKGVNATYVSRVLWLTLLAPEIVEAILDGRQPAELQLNDLLVGHGDGRAGFGARLEARFWGRRFELSGDGASRRDIDPRRLTRCGRPRLVPNRLRTRRDPCYNATIILRRSKLQARLHSITRRRISWRQVDRYMEQADVPLP